MTSFQSFVGIDMASTSFMACAGTPPWKLTIKPIQFDNQEEGFVLSCLVRGTQAICRTNRDLHGSHRSLQ